ncbi:MAG: CCA tRNA nucleotidyltransferase, partial [Acidimicrobiales bacterium]
MIPGRVRPLLEETASLAERFGAAGHRIYLVGGAVRDLLARPGQTATADLDLSTDATPDEIVALLDGWAESLWLAGRRFGTIGALHAGRRYEITTHRAEVYRPESRKPEVRFASRIEDDLERRDFSVNAMALSLPDPVLIDPFGGLEDLAARRLRTPLPPEISFEEDPLRMLRAARFVAGYGLEPDPPLVGAISAMRGRLEVVSAERIRDELDKLLVVADPSPVLWLLVETGLAGEFLPELPALA